MWWMEEHPRILVRSHCEAKVGAGFPDDLILPGDGLFVGTGDAEKTLF